MKINVAISSMKIEKKCSNVLSAQNLGSDLAISIYDPDTGVGGIIHFMLPDSSVYPEAAKKNPLIFADTGIPIFLNAFFSYGTSRQRLVANVAGGADLIVKGKSLFSVGQQNIAKAVVLLAQNKLAIAQQTVGGTKTRHLFIELSSGKTWVDDTNSRLEIC